MKIREIINRFFSLNEASWEIFMVIMAIIYVLIGFLPDLLHVSQTNLLLLGKIDQAITGLFLIEFVVRFTSAFSRKNYLREHWLDLLSLIPAIRWLRMFRILRILRLLRIARAIKVLNSIDNFTVNVQKFARLNSLQWMLLTLFLVMLVSLALFFYFEHSANEKIQNYWDALYASLVTWTTPGYGDIAPVTMGGRISGLILIISGLVTWGILIANLAAFLTDLSKTEEKTEPVLLDLQKRLSHIDELSATELICLRGALNALIERKLEEKK